jgi:hypothetical protein
MPQRTIQLLDELSSLGFTDGDFRILHHLKSKDETVGGMRAYCMTIGSFRDGSPNERVRARLQFVLTKIRAEKHPAPAPPGIFRALCNEAVAKIPK